MKRGKRLRPLGMRSSIFAFAFWIPPAIYAFSQASTSIENTWVASPEDSSRQYANKLEEYHIDLDQIESGNMQSSQTSDEVRNMVATTPPPSHELMGVVVVATLDGTFYGLDTVTGNTIWKQSGLSQTTDQNDFASFHSKHTSTIANAQRFFMPMVSTTSTTRPYYKKPRSTSSSQLDTSTLAIPSIDGRVFLTPFTKDEEEYYHKLWRTLRPDSTTPEHNTYPSHSKIRGKGKSILWNPHKDWTISTTTRDIVDQSPFFDAQGRLYLGSCASMTAALDRDTGDLVHIFPKSHPMDLKQEQDTRNKEETQNEVDSLHRHCSEKNETTDDNIPLTSKPRNLVWIGREDYSVSIFHPPSLQEDVRFSTSHLYSINEMMYDQYQVNFGSEEKDTHNVDEKEEDTSLQIIDQRKRSKKTYDLSFQLPFHTKEDSGLSNNDPRYGFFDSLLPVNDERIPFSGRARSVVSTPDGQLVMQNPETGQVLWMTEEIFSSPVVFAMDSYTGRSLYLEISQDISTDNLHEETAMIGALASGQLFAVPLHRNNPQGIRRLPRLISTKATNAASGDIALWTPDKSLSQKIDLTHPTNHQFNLDGRSKALASLSHRCDPSMVTFPQCLFNPLQADKDSIRMDGNSHLNVDLMNFLTAGYLPPDIWKETQRAEEERRAKKSRFNFIFRLLLSWIPPAVALSFVVSFELGRRERERKRRRDAVTPETSNRLYVTEKNPGQREPSESQDPMPTLEEEKNNFQHENSTRLIQVSDTVLGYGGHGTVVFKGSLAGRSVAVKRMLKNYHASADREISLLIESDGHPNVVRYFFKEIRGDFVYLALEMCDASLHDLITSVARGVTKQNYDQHVLAYVTKKVLFHIVLGVKHLHDLRIVHRDLKPQNILLAHKNRCENSFHLETDDSFDQLFLGFMNDNFLPKISDMGLGKQLTSQSSYGVSTKGVEFHEGSTIGGAGPGSVGWQAPEVMARRSMDLPVKSVDQCTDSKDGSPTPDGSLNTRTSRSVDIFSLGCVFFSTLLPGSHPFGEWYEREANIMKNQPEISMLENLSYEAFDLVSRMIQRDSKCRPTAAQVCDHPYFWDSVKRSSFLCDFSDRLEAESLLISNNGVPSFDILVVERNAQNVVGDAWTLQVDQDLLLHLSRYRSYDPSSVRDCLRMIRNKHHHFDEIPVELRQRMFNGSENLQGYFESKFPRIVQHCYNICRSCLSVDDPLNIKYRIPSARTSLSMDESSSSSNTPASNTNAELRKGLISTQSSESFSNTKVPPLDSLCLLSPDGLVIWEGSNLAKSYNCRGWMRSQEVWALGSDHGSKKRDININRCLEDPKFRTRLCNHWDMSFGVSCPMRKKYKCVFAHGPIELRVKEGKKERWGKLVDKDGNHSNPCHSGGEDTYGAAKLIETTRQGQGKIKI